MVQHPTVDEAGAVNRETPMSRLLLASVFVLIAGCRRDAPPPEQPHTEQPKPPAKKERANDEERMQGTWRAVQRNGNPSSFSITWQFKGKQVVLNEGGTISAGTFTMNSQASLKTLDLDTDMGRFACLYEFKGDVLSVCFESEENQPRPAEFSATGSPTRVLFKFVRQ